MTFEEPLGVLCLGGLVGFLLAWGLAASKPTLKAIITVIGAGLGGAPVAFLAASGHRWLYPIGLLVGFLWVRAGALYRAGELERRANFPAVRPMPARVVATISAMVVITIVVLAYPFVASTATVTEQAGEIRVLAFGAYEVFYREAFVSPPTLTLPPTTGQSEDIQILEQRADGFKVQIGLGTTHGAIIKWRAVGRVFRSPSG
jgi:hypothetical protein